MSCRQSKRVFFFLPMCVRRCYGRNLNFQLRRFSNQNDGFSRKRVSENMTHIFLYYFLLPSSLFFKKSTNRKFRYLFHHSFFYKCRDGQSFPFIGVYLFTCEKEGGVELYGACSNGLTGQALRPMTDATIEQVCRHARCFLSTS